MSEQTTEGRTPSRDLKPGTRVRWRGTSEAVLERRKEPPTSLTWHTVGATTTN